MSFTPEQHDQVVRYYARTRMPFEGQEDWPKNYITLTNETEKKFAIPFEGGKHYPDVVVIDENNDTHEIVEVELDVQESLAAKWKACSAAADDRNPLHIRHFFVTVPPGQEKAAKAILEQNNISYAGIRSFVFDASGSLRIEAYETLNCDRDHRDT